MKLSRWGIVCAVVCGVSLYRYGAIAEPAPSVVMQEQREDRVQTAKLLAMQDYKQQQMCLRQTPQEWCNRDQSLEDYYATYHKALEGKEFSETKFKYDLEGRIYLLIAIIFGYFGYSLIFSKRSEQD